MDVNRALRNAVQTGKVALGTKESLKTIDEGHARLVVVAENVPAAWGARIVERATKKGVPLYRYQGTNGALGQACGKPFGVASLAVQEAGQSDILALARQA